jgi:carnitine O-acetyltransferase
MAEDGVTASELPQLPIPELSETLEKYLRAVKPLLCADEYAETMRVVEAFGSKEGKQLDEELRKKSAGEEGSFLEAWWRRAYLEGRQCTAVNVNPFFVLEVCNLPFFSVREGVSLNACAFLAQDDATPNRGSQVARATSLIVSMLAFHRKVAVDELPVDEWRTTKLCMEQYKVRARSRRVATSL